MRTKIIYKLDNTYVLAICKPIASVMIRHNRKPIDTCCTTAKYVRQIKLANVTESKY